MSSHGFALLSYMFLTVRRVRSHWIESLGSPPLHDHFDVHTSTATPAASPWAHTGASAVDGRRFESVVVLGD